MRRCSPIKFVNRCYKRRRLGGVFPAEGKGEPAPPDQPMTPNGRAASRVGPDAILTYVALPLARLVEAAVDIGDFCHPPLSFAMFEIQDFAAWPMKVVGDVGYLLVQALKGVAAYSPPRLARSTSNSV